MSPVAASGILSLPLNYLRLTIAEVAAFQTWVGLTPPDAAGALAFVYPMAIDVSTTVPANYCVIDWAENFRREYVAGGSRNYFGAAGDLVMLLHETITPADDYADAAFRFTNNTGAIIAGMEALAGTAGFLDIRNISFAERPRRATRDEAESEKYDNGDLVGDCFEGLYTVEFAGA